LAHFSSAHQLILESANQPQRLIPHVWRKGLNLNDSTAEYSACSIVAQHDKNRYRRKPRNKRLTVSPLLRGFGGARWPGRPRGAIGASLDFFALLFLSRKKVEKMSEKKRLKQ
jgi:hypothetical protein